MKDNSTWKNKAEENTQIAQMNLQTWYECCTCVKTQFSAIFSNLFEKGFLLVLPQKENDCMKKYIFRTYITLQYFLIPHYTSHAKYFLIPHLYFSCQTSKITKNLSDNKKKVKPEYIYDLSFHLIPSTVQLPSHVATKPRNQALKWWFLHEYIQPCIF